MDYKPKPKDANMQKAMPSAFRKWTAITLLATFSIGGIAGCSNQGNENGKSQNITRNTPSSPTQIQPSTQQQEGAILSIKGPIISIFAMNGASRFLEPGSPIEGLDYVPAMKEIGWRTLDSAKVYVDNSKLEEMGMTTFNLKKEGVTGYMQITCTRNGVIGIIGMTH